MSDGRRMWNIYRELIGSCSQNVPSEIVVNDVKYCGNDAAHLFNNHFINAGAPTSIFGFSQNRNYESFIGNRVSETIFLVSTSESEIFSIINSLSNKSAAGEDGIKAQPN